MSTPRETHGFQAEVRQLLQLMIHSLYSHREIFLRELVSNASDANDKLRFLALADPQLMAPAGSEDGGGERELAVWIEHDAAAGTVTIRDNGIGMTREEAIAHLGTIAKSGTAEFFSRLSGDQQKDAQLIGQFGVGFYSAFIVAQRVVVESRRAGEPASAAIRWSSEADGEYTIEPIERAARGTSVVLHLKDDAKEFADGWRLRALVRRYSDHIAFPVYLPKEGSATLDFEAVNQAQALWTRPKPDLTDEDYAGFYKHIAHDGAEPLAWSHNRVEGKREYTSLLYVPGQPPFDLWQREAPRGLKLYVRRVFIMDNAEQFLPLYLRFIRGVVDSSDLPLNVSRELLQQDADVEAMRAALTRRALDMLAKLAKDDADKYRQCWQHFGQVLKEGIAEDAGNRERLLPLLRFASTASEGDAQPVSLADYLARMQPGQERIYFLVGESIAAARGSPVLERLRARGVEVLLLGERVDAWIADRLGEYEGKRFKDVARGELELGSLAGADEQAQAEAALKASKGLLKRVKDVLGERVAEVRPSTRLADSPACLVHGEGELSESMRRMLATHGQEMPASAPVLELNVAHPLLRYLDTLADAQAFAGLAEVLYGQARLTDSGQLEAPAEFARQLNGLLLRLSGFERPQPA
jgi:molecular chaperone HtpG